MANKKLVLNLFEQFRVYLNKIKILQPKIGSLKNFQEDWETELKVERILQLIIECSIDIGKEIITGLELKRPERYQEVFIILSEISAVSPGISKKMQELTRFRNELVHDYLYLNRKKIYNIFKNDIKYFEQYLLEIEKFVKKLK